MKELVPYLILSIILLILTVIFIIVYPTLRKIRYEKNFFNIYGRYIYRLANKDDYYLINKCSLKTYDEQIINIDHLLFGNKYIYIIKNYYFDGVIEGKANDKRWLNYKKENGKIVRNSFDNPLLINEVRLQRFHDVSRIDKSFLISIILVNNDTYLSSDLNIKKDNSYFVKLSKLPHLIHEIERREVPNLNENSLKNFVLDISRLNLNNNEKR